MQAERWRQLKEVFSRASSLDLEARQAYLDEACGDDPSLRAEVDALLHAHQAPDAILDRVAADYVPAEALAPTEDRWIGRRIGAYELVAHIGRGGMGDVYRARRVDAQFDKEVAIKLVRAGFDTASVIKRFQYERQILASLEDPNIARLYDGGTTEDGIPYLVEELIDGVPITEYCDERGLGPAERIRLFQSVCAAVQFAHRRGVIHRDLKPGNILVTKDRVPKLIDFGIARLLDQPAQVEATQLRPMTPEYASPEQVRDAVITTATDVYSLGVVLYELLTGRTPFAGMTGSAHDLSRAICETAPMRPSAAVLLPRESRRDGAPILLSAAEICARRHATPQSLQQQLQDDLDNIVLTALEKEPERRYASVEQLAEDLRRQQNGLPVTASAPRWGYRTSKFIRRHRVASAATVLATLAVLAGIGATLREAQIARHQASIAQQQRQRAERRFDDVRKLANALLFEIHDSIRDLPGSTPARKLLVTRALEYLDSLSKEAGSDSSLQRELATAYQKVGDVQGQSREASLGDRAGAEISYRKACELREALVAGNPRSAELRRDLVQSYGKLSDLLRDKGDLAGSMEYSRLQMDSAEAVVRMDPTNADTRILFATYRMDHGYKQATVGRERAAGLENLRQGSALLEQLALERPQDTYVHRVLGLSYSREAEILEDEADSRPRALALYQKALAVSQALLDADPNNTDYERIVAFDKFDIGSVLMRSGQWDGAVSWDRRALADFQRLATADPASQLFRQDTAEVRRELGQMLLQTGQPAQAITELLQSLEVVAPMTGASDPMTAEGRVLLDDQYWLGQVQLRLATAPQTPDAQRREHCSAALDWFHKALPGLETLRARVGTDAAPDEHIRQIRAARSRCQAAPAV